MDFLEKWKLLLSLWPGGGYNGGRNEKEGAENGIAAADGGI